MIELIYCFQILFHLDIGANSNFVSGKSRQGKFEFEVKIERNRKYLLRVGIYTVIKKVQCVFLKHFGEYLDNSAV